MAESWRDTAKKGDILDVKWDGEWKRARIVTVTASQFRCESLAKRADGRIQREFIRKASERLAPAGTHTQESSQTPTASSTEGAGGGEGVPGATPSGQFQRGEMIQGFGMTLSLNQKCDCLDNQKWRKATVIDVREGMLKIHFEGWSSKWDEWIPVRARRIQPYKSQTGETYTGDTRSQQEGGQGAQQNIPAGFFDPVVVDSSPKMWKRVLSHGLSDKQVKALDIIFEQACNLQDRQRAIVLGRSVDIEKLTADLSEYKSKLVKADLPASVTPYLQICRNIVSDIKSTLFETLKQKKQQQLLGVEDKYFQKLQKSFYFVRIPSDGNCLFGATGRGMKYAKTLTGCKHDGDVKKVVEEARKITKETSTTIATEERLKAVMHLRTDTKYRATIIAEVKHAVETASLGKGNPTSKTILNRMKHTFPGKDLMKAAETKDALDVYCTVMCSERVFGTELEARALSEVLKAPLHIYYRVTNDFEKVEEIKATKIIGVEFESENPPVHLAFYMGKSHYDLLIRRHKVPDPEEEKRKKQREETRKTAGFKCYRLIVTKTGEGQDAKCCEISQIRLFNRTSYLMKQPKLVDGRCAPNYSTINLVDGTEETKMVDENFKKNKKSVLQYEFEKSVPITDYEICYAIPNTNGPRSWELIGVSEDGEVVLDKQEDAKIKGASIKGKISYFKIPEQKEGKAEEKKSEESKEMKSESKGEESKEANESKMEVESDENKTEEMEVEPVVVAVNKDAVADEGVVVGDVVVVDSLGDAASLDPA